MKLVQLLAKELKEWPEGAKYACQDTAGTYEGSVFFVSNEPEYSDGSGGWSVCGVIDAIYNLEVSSDAKIKTVTKSQWRAEREKMNKPKWIRHRGGLNPIDNDVLVEVKLRSGGIQSAYSSDFIWRHVCCDYSANIMQYRIMQETENQEIEEVETIDTAKEPTIEYAFGDKDSDPKDLDWKQLGTLTYKLEIDATEATKEIDSLIAKWGQIESPLKWRDAIIHCQAIIEDCEREIERNVILLDAEGLMMQKDSKKAMQHYQTDIDMSDWRNWQAGDVIEIVANEAAHEFENGEEVIVSRLDINDIDMSVKAEYKDGSDYWWLSGKDAKFIRRP